MASSQKGGVVRHDCRYRSDCDQNCSGDFNVPNCKERNKSCHELGQISDRERGLLCTFIPI